MRDKLSPRLRDKLTLSKAPDTIPFLAHMHTHPYSKRAHLFLFSLSFLLFLPLFS